jgi:flagellar motility protein MotE (MotC chaperone)
MAEIKSFISDKTNISIGLLLTIGGFLVVHMMGFATYSQKTDQNEKDIAVVQAKVDQLEKNFNTQNTSFVERTTRIETKLDLLLNKK